MKHKRIALAHVLILLALAVGCASVSAKETIRFLGVGYGPDMVNLLQERLFPEFEKLYDVDVVYEHTTWAERVDRFTVQTVGGVSPDIISTGFYSAYEEGATGLLIPLDKYLTSFKYKQHIPQPIWDAMKWDGQTYAIPYEVDVRGILYNKAMFEQAGYPPTAPRSWDAILEITRRMTTFTPDGRQVVTRGIQMDAIAQNLYWFILQTDTPLLDLTNLKAIKANFDKPGALAAAEFLQQLHQATAADVPGPRSGELLNNRTAMSHYYNRALFRTMDPNVVRQLGAFSPQRTATSRPVSAGFINGWAITKQSKNPDLAWKLIEFLTTKEVMDQILDASGAITPRMDIAPRLMQQPGIDLYYNMIPNIATMIMPPPRNRSQGQVDQLVKAMNSMRMSPNETLINIQNLWTQLISAWDIAK